MPLNVLIVSCKHELMDDLYLVGRGPLNTVTVISICTWQTAAHLLMDALDEAGIVTSCVLINYQ